MDLCRLRVSAFLLTVLLMSAGPASAQVAINLAWNANSEPDVVGYVVSWGTRSGVYTASADAGNHTQHTVSGLNPDQRYYFVVQAYTSEPRLFSAPSLEVSNNGLIVSTGAALADPRPNLFWHNQRTGRVMTWHLNGTTVADTRSLSISGITDTNWKVAGVGDLNADAHADILWRHATDGRLAAWLLRNNEVIATEFLSVVVADPAWRVGGLGDVDGDRYADIVWQHSDGRLALWSMRGSTIASTAVMSLNVGPNSRWQIATIGDVNKDGFADIVWQTTDAWLAVWLLRGPQVQLTQYLSIPQMPDANWRIRSVASPDATGHPALVWRHQGNGSVALWYMNAATVVATIKTTPSIVDNLDWVLVGSR